MDIPSTLKSRYDNANRRTRLMVDQTEEQRLQLVQENFIKEIKLTVQRMIVEDIITKKNSSEDRLVSSICGYLRIDYKKVKSLFKDYFKCHKKIPLNNTHELVKWGQWYLDFIPKQLQSLVEDESHPFVHDSWLKE